MADTEAPGESAEVAQVAEPVPDRRESRPILVLALVIVIAAIGFLWFQWWSDQPERLLGDHGTVTAMVSGGRMRVETDGLRLASECPYLHVRDGMARGRLEVTKVKGPSGTMSAVFTGDDGTIVLLRGAEIDNQNVFEFMECPIEGA